MWNVKQKMPPQNPQQAGSYREQMVVASWGLGLGEMGEGGQKVKKKGNCIPDYSVNCHCLDIKYF